MSNASAPPRPTVRPLPAKPRRKAESTEARAPLTPDTWIEAATEVLVDQGIDHVRVDVLAGQLKVTRGSFYWHFRDREELLRAVLQAWRESATEALTSRLEKAHADPREQLRDVLSLPFRGRAALRAARIELAIRAWARRDNMARSAVDEADASRRAYIAQLFSALGFPVLEARSRAFLLYAYLVAESLMSTQGAASERAERARFVEQLIGLPLKAGKGA
ncbi:TetR/AcrR family transcriptional regulator [Ideonella sp. BN130291]|uniref:TetR/AcrR family transcriptional regulator n=1 Tax=Ideonella sp. BN130291 TaxID=3112940 RepID=UPI002E2655A0|nr:TetR/AcrR family transcriptional regulator [Ideonella sp. BN130291]